MPGKGRYRRATNSAIACLRLSVVAAGGNGQASLTAGAENGMLLPTVMSKVKTDYGSLAKLDTTALHEFEQELQRKMAREQREREQPKKKRRKRR